MSDVITFGGRGAWVLHMPAVGLVVDDRGRMKQSVLGYPWDDVSVPGVAPGAGLMGKAA